MALTLTDSFCAFLRNFIWSMTSWKRGLTCRQHSTTTQPSRPSKARPIQKAAAVPAHNTVGPGGGAVVHRARFLFLEDLTILTAGVVATIKTALPFQNYMLPKTPTLVLFLFFMFLLFFCLVSSRVCVMFTSLNLKPVFF